MGWLKGLVNSFQPLRIQPQNLTHQALHLSQPHIASSGIPCAWQAGSTFWPMWWRKPMQQIFAEFGGALPSGGEYYGTGDVKYHLGTSYDRPTISGKRVHLSLLANPSHLEVSGLLRI